MTDNRKLEDYIKERIAESGYPLEIEVSNILECLHYSVYNTNYFLDPDTKEGRSIDILASPSFLKENPLEFNKIIKFEDLALECKKSNYYSWVFFTRLNECNKGFSPSEIISGQCKTSIPNNINPSGASIDDWLILELYPKSHYSSSERIAIAYQEVKSKSLDQKPEGSSIGRQEIFEAVMQLTKFVNYRMHGRLGLISQKKSVSCELSYFIFPCIVFE